VVSKDAPLSPGGPAVRISSSGESATNRELQGIEITSGGTESSNPVPSSGESATNCTGGARIDLGPSHGRSARGGTDGSNPVPSSRESIANRGHGAECRNLTRQLPYPVRPR